METISNPKDYSHLLEYDFNQTISSLHVEMIEVISATEDSSNKKGKTISFTIDNRDLKTKSLAQLLIENDVILDTPEYREAVDKKLNDRVHGIISNQIRLYKDGVAIHNALVDLNVKDKRQWGTDENNGKINDKKFRIQGINDRHGSMEVSSNLESCEEYLNNFGGDKGFELRFDNPSNYTRIGSEWGYVYSDGMAKGGHYDLVIRFNLECYGTHLPKSEAHNRERNSVMIPRPKLNYLYLQNDMQIGRVSLLRAVEVKNEWVSSKQKYMTRFKCQHSAVQREYRQVNLNTFICYCRDKTRDNIVDYHHKARKSQQFITMKDKLVEMYPEAEVFKKEGYKNDLNHNFYSYWGRYGKDVVKVKFENGNYIYYSKGDMESGKLNMMGLYEKDKFVETKESIYERVTGMSYESNHKTEEKC